MKNKYPFLFLVTVFTHFSCHVANNASLLSSPEGKIWTIVKENHFDYSGTTNVDGYILYDHNTAFRIWYNTKTMKETLLFSNCDDCGGDATIRDAYCYWEIKDDTLFIKVAKYSPYNVFKGKIAFLSEDSLVVIPLNDTFVFKPRY